MGPPPRGAGPARRAPAGARAAAARRTWVTVGIWTASWKRRRAPSKPPGMAASKAAHVALGVCTGPDRGGGFFRLATYASRRGVSSSMSNKGWLRARGAGQPRRRSDANADGRLPARAARARSAPQRPPLPCLLTPRDRRTARGGAPARVAGRRPAAQTRGPAICDRCAGVSGGWRRRREWRVAAAAAAAAGRQRRRRQGTSRWPAL